MRKAESLHHQNLLEINKYNFKKSRGVLRDIIGKKSNPSNCVTFIIGKTTASDIHKFVDGFNNYFVNVGPALENKIEADTTGKSPKSYIDKRNTNLLFLSLPPATFVT